MEPVGEYAMSVLGRERLFTISVRRMGHRGPGQAVLRQRNAVRNTARHRRARTAGQPIDLTMGYLNAIWQGDSNAMTLRCFDLTASPPRVINVAGGNKLSVADVAQRFGELFDKSVQPEGTPAARRLVV